MNLEFVDNIKNEHEQLQRNNEDLLPGKTWLIGATPFFISKKLHKQILRLGQILEKYLNASNSFYLRSLKNSLPEYIARILNSGKPDWLLELAKTNAQKNLLPKIIRPDLILTENGFTMAEIDSVPGGIGFTAWLNKIYSQKYNVIGGSHDMLNAFGNLFNSTKNDINYVLISKESHDYLNEMRWLVKNINKRNESKWKTAKAENFDFEKNKKNNIYRFFELFDYKNVAFKKLINNQSYLDGKFEITSPIVPHLEEKMWSALYWLAPLRKLWQQELRRSNDDFLKEIIPYSWLMDPADLPYNAVLPKLELQNWAEVAEFSQSKRNYLLKISGFSEIGWGSRSITLGNDVSKDIWQNSIHNALKSFESNPYIMQNFHKGKTFNYSYYDPKYNEIKQMNGRVRLCPYFLRNDSKNKVELCGILATICPADKKIIHGMSEAVLAPCAIEN